ncbi:glycosyltransferase family 2 protein [Lactobacillaceae bacterium 24-114]
MKKISVIVLTYNVGEYLRECLESILNQTYNNLEIILVDDSSTDNSLAISEEFCQKDQRVRLIQQPNSGAGPVRNLGVSVATGDYIMFIDGDDILSTNMVADLYQQAEENNADISCCLFYRIDEQGTYYFYSDPHNPNHSALEKTYSSLDWLENEVRPVIGQIFYQAWGKLFKRNLFKNVEYPSHSYGDDGLTGWKLYLSADKISYINMPGYCWRMRNNSITTTKRPNVRVSRNNALGIQERIQFYPFIGLNPVFLHKRWQEYLEKQENDAKTTGNLLIQKEAESKLAIIKKYLEK